MSQTVALLAYGDAPQFQPGLSSARMWVSLLVHSSEAYCTRSDSTTLCSMDIRVKVGSLLLDGSFLLFGLSRFSKTCHSRTFDPSHPPPPSKCSRPLLAVQIPPQRANHRPMKKPLRSRTYIASPGAHGPSSSPCRGWP